MTRVSHDGKTDSLTELELLVRVFERSQNVPQCLRDYALEQVERADELESFMSNHRSSVGGFSAASASPKERALKATSRRQPT